MKDAVLLLCVAGIMGLGYWAACHISTFFAGAPAEETGENTVRILLCTAVLPDALASALTPVRGESPAVRFLGAAPEQMVSYLTGRRAKLAVAAGDCTAQCPENIAAQCVTGGSDTLGTAIAGIPVSQADKPAVYTILWCKNTASPDRDRLLSRLSAAAR